MRKRQEYDEDDIRTRPGRSTKPRSKARPQFNDATAARVITIDRGRVTCATDDGRAFFAITARELGRRSVVVGDLVSVVGIPNLHQAREDFARIVRIEERKNSLRRSAEDGSERTLVANVDYLAIVSATENPEPKHGFVNRALVAAFAEGITPLLIMTKSDLASGSGFLKTYEAMDLPTFQLQKDRSPDDLTGFIKGKVTVLIGHSGVGKSTLINKIVREIVRETGPVNEATGKGRHTSSSALALQLDCGGWIIDTPGVRSFGLSHIEKSDVVGAFPDCAEVAKNCPKNCSHDETGCALNGWAADNNARLARVDALRQILASLDS
jgi:ribosome biogenesis GTPase